MATEALPGHFSGIGVYVDAGSRYENEELRGVSHIVDRLAFKVLSSLIRFEFVANMRDFLVNQFSNIRSNARVS